MMNSSVFRYELQFEGMDESRMKQELEKINTELLKKLQDLDSDIEFSSGWYLFMSQSKSVMMKVTAFILLNCLFALSSSFQALNLEQRRTVFLLA